MLGPKRWLQHQNAHGAMPQKNGLDFPLGNFHVEKLQYITIDVHVFFATFGQLVQTG